MHKSILNSNKFLLTTLLLLLIHVLHSQNVVIAIIDGARYTETFGDDQATYIPNMAELAKKGSILSEFHNDSITFTSAAIPAIWCGTWTQRNDTNFNGGNTQYTMKPSIFEYVRKQKNLEATKCIYSLKYVSSLWLPSFHTHYGPDYWPYTISQGTNDTDVLNNSIAALKEHKPEFAIVYFADVDNAGHSGNWDNYTQAIQTADIAVNELWEALQADSFYKDNTVLIVTNDHGRHDDLHGGFKGHGCSCQGCRKIMFLAIGPGIKENYRSNKYRRIPDVAVTAASILNIEAEYASGQVINEIFTSNTSLQNSQQQPNWQINGNSVLFKINTNGKLKLTVHNIIGSQIYSTTVDISNGNSIQWNHGFGKGVYIISVTGKTKTETKKVIVK